MLKLGGTIYTVDRAATVRAYADAALGGADACGCAYCRNFRIARALVFPRAFLDLLDELGIDPLKDAEVYECGRTEKGHNYGGWFHFVGRLAAGSDLQDVGFGAEFSAKLSPAVAPRLAPLKSVEAVELRFFCTAVPWLLDEPDPG